MPVVLQSNSAMWPTTFDDHRSSRCAHGRPTARGPTTKSQDMAAHAGLIGQVDAWTDRTGRRRGDLTCRRWDRSDRATRGLIRQAAAGTDWKDPHGGCLDRPPRGSNGKVEWPRLQRQGGSKARSPTQGGPAPKGSNKSCNEKQI